MSLLTNEELNVRLRKGITNTEPVEAPEWKGDDDDEAPEFLVRGLTVGEVSEVSVAALKGMQLELGGMDMDSDEKDIQSAMKSADLRMNFDLSGLTDSNDKAQRIAVAHGMTIEGGKKFSPKDVANLPPSLFSRVVEKVVELTDSKDLEEALQTFRDVRARATTLDGDGPGPDSDEDSGDDDASSSNLHAVGASDSEG